MAPEHTILQVSSKTSQCFVASLWPDALHRGIDWVKSPKGDRGLHPTSRKATSLSTQGKLHCSGSLGRLRAFVDEAEAHVPEQMRPMPVSISPSLSQVDIGELRKSASVALPETLVEQSHPEPEFPVTEPCHPALEPAQHASEAIPMRGMPSNPDPSQESRVPYENTHEREA
jgi:hypothetical protein